MSEVSTISNQPKPARIRIDVPMGTSYLEIQASILHQAWQLAGTQLRAAIALGITPETISRVLRRCDHLGIGCPKVPEAWPVVEVNRVIGPSGQKTDRVIAPSGYRALDRENPKPDQAISSARVNNKANPSSVGLTPFSEEAEEEIDSSTNLRDDTERNDL